MSVTDCPAWCMGHDEGGEADNHQSSMRSFGRIDSEGIPEDVFVWLGLAREVPAQGRDGLSVTVNIAVNDGHPVILSEHEARTVAAMLLDRADLATGIRQV